MASWAVRLPDGRTAPRAPAAPVLLRACTLRATGAAQGDYVLDLGTDLELNPVLVHYLASEQGITLDDDALEALATRGPTFDPYPVYAALAEACAAVPDFAVTPRLVVGTFSYAKLPMVADLAAQGDALADHDVVAALAGDPDALRSVRSELDPSRVDLDDPERDVLVLDADSSQQEAIEAVRSGSHLVIHGPPGTGKSQTIANLIATLAADGKRVLFVAEKRAAIDAVVGRLDRVGLGGLVLDLHAGAHGPPTRGARARRRPRPARPARGHPRAHRHRVARCRPPRGSPRPRRPDAPRPTGSASTCGRCTSGGSRGGSRCTRCRRPSPPSRACPPHLGRGCGCAARCSPGSTATSCPRRPPRSRRSRRWPTGTPTARTTPGSAPASARPRRRPRRASGSSGSPAARSTPRPAPSPTCSAASSCPRRRRPATGGACSSTVGDVRDTLEVFRPEVFDIPLDDLVTATGSSAYRRSVGSDLGWLDRWRLRRQARALLRPGRPPADLHAALAAASEQRVAWRQLAGSGGRPEIPVELDRARVSHAALVADLEWLDQHLPGARAGGRRPDGGCRDVARRPRPRLAARPGRRPRRRRPAGSGWCPR